MKLATKIGTPQILIIVLTIATAVIHLILSLLFQGGPLFLLNGLGYLGLLALYFIQFSFLPIKREWVRYALMGYAALTIILYLGMQISSGGEFVSPLGVITKVIEIVLIFFLWRDR